jgi:hypothetical protein
MLPLEGADVSPSLQGVRGKGMAKRVAADSLGDSHPRHRCFDRFIDGRLIQVIASERTA